MKPEVSIVDAVTGEQTVREMNDDELARSKKAEEANETRIELIVKKVEAKAAAEAKLAALGLTADDLRALGL